MEQAAQNKNSGSDWSKQIKTIESITMEVQQWRVRYMVESKVALDMQGSSRWRCGIMEMAVAQYDDII